MRQPALQAQIDAAEAYEAVMVPALFAEWPICVVDQAKISPGHRVLDVACGTGVLSRAAAARTSDASGRQSASGSVTGLDASAGMIAVARRCGPALHWARGKAEALPFSDAVFDAVVSQFGLMFFTDRVAALKEMLRVLVPGGTLTVAVWDSEDNSPAYAAEIAVIERIAGRAAADALRAPFVLGDTGELMALFESAGASSPAVLTQTGTARFPNVRTMVEADLRGWLPVMGITLTDAQIGRIIAEASGELAEFVVHTGEVVFDSPAHLVSARK